MKRGCLILAVLLMCGCANADVKQDEATADTTKIQEEAQEETTVEVLDNGVYFAPEHPTAYVAETYEQLTAALDKDDAAQAEAAARCFLADFFTLAGKEDEHDIGGLDFIPSASAEQFREYAEYYYYDAYADIVSQDGKAQLPSVTNVELTNPQQTKVEYDGESYDGWTYDVKLEYRKSTQSSKFKTAAKCTIIKMNDVHYVDQSAVTSDKEAGEPAEVWRITAVTD